MTMNRSSSVQNGLIDSATLTFDLLTPKLCHVYDIKTQKVISCTKFEHFGISHVWFMMQTNKQTNMQTDSKILPTSTNIVGASNNKGDTIRYWHYVRMRNILS